MTIVHIPKCDPRVERIGKEMQVIVHSDICGAHGERQIRILASEVPPEVYAEAVFAAELERDEREAQWLS